MNMFRLKDGSLDKQYLRTCAVYDLCKKGKIGKDRAIELLAERGTGPAVVEIWFRRPFPWT